MKRLSWVALAAVLLSGPAQARLTDPGQPVAPEPYRWRGVLMASAQDNGFSSAPGGASAGRGGDYSESGSAYPCRRCDLADLTATIRSLMSQGFTFSYNAQTNTVSVDHTGGDHVPSSRSDGQGGRAGF